MVLADQKTLQLTRPQGDMTVAAHQTLIPRVLILLQSAPALLRQLSGLEVPAAFSLAQTSMPGIAFPLPCGFYRGSLGPWFPTRSAEVAPCPAVLCVATTAFVRPGRCALCSLPVPWFDALWFVSRTACAGFGSPVGRADPTRRQGVGYAGHPPSGCCSQGDGRLSRVPGLPFVHMPRSQTPVVSRPLTLARTGLMPSDHSISWALGPVARTYLLSTIIHFSEFNDAACVLALPLTSHTIFRDRTSVRLPTGVASLWSGGNLSIPLTHWVNFDMFKRCLLYPHIPSLSSAREVIC